MIQRDTVVLGLALVALAGLVTVTSAQGVAGDAKIGKKLFEDSNDLEYPSCAHCHATVPVQDELKKTGVVRIAHPVFNTTHRGAYKNKAKGKDPTTPGDAGNQCAKAFQERKKGLPKQDIAHLNAYMATISPDKEVKPRKIGYKPKVLASFDGGDAEKGKKAVQVYCSTCHGDSDEHVAFGFKRNRITKKKIAMKVRGWVRSSKAKSGMRFSPAKGMMSFFAKDRLSDKDLLDIIAYLGK